MKLHMHEPKLIIHGGAGSLEGQVGKRESFDHSLQRILADTWKILCTSNAEEAVLSGVRALESDPIFNAGLGSRIQADGKIRMSAAYMDSSRGIFSGVINVQEIEHPIDLAYQLQGETNTVLAGDPATEFAHIHGYPLFNPETDARREEYHRRQQGKSGTVGVLALDSQGRIAAGTSTGGIGNEIPGRVSDSPTVAGNFASNNAAVSATGWGEEIVNLAVSSSIVTLVDTGISLEKAVDHVVQLGKQNGYHFGLIALDKQGNLIADRTINEIFYASTDGKATITFYDETAV